MNFLSLVIVPWHYCQSISAGIALSSRYAFKDLLVEYFPFNTSENVSEPIKVPFIMLLTKKLQKLLDSIPINILSQPLQVYYYHLRSKVKRARFFRACLFFTRDIFPRQQ